MKKAEIILRLLRIPLDFLSVTVAFLLAYYLRSHPELLMFVGDRFDFAITFSQFLWFVFQAGLLFVVLIALDGGYRLHRHVPFRKEAWTLLLVATAWLMLIVFYFFLFRIVFFSRLILGMAFVFTLLFVFFHRFSIALLRRYLRKRGILRRRILLIGSGKVREDLKKHFVRNSAFEVMVSDGLSLEGLSRFIQEHSVEEVVQVGGRDVFSEGLVEYCQLHHVEYQFVPDILEIQRTRVDVDFVGSIPLIALRANGITPWGRVVKRFFDIIFSLLFLIFLSPLFLAIAFCIAVDSGRPVLYRSTRVSRDKIIHMWKFRSMVENADSLKGTLFDHNKRKGPLFKIENDPRITPVGRFLRKWSLDELPQLFNVFKGDLSLVGPRAHLPEEIEQYEKHHRRVLAVKAGVTGLAQVSGRSHLDFEQEVKLDVYYLENWSLWLDFWILWKTLWTVLEGKGE